MEQQETLKLFVWYDVYCDYTCGMAFAVAHNKEEAIISILGKDNPWMRKELDTTEPEVYELNTITPMGWLVMGGG